MRTLPALLVLLEHAQPAQGLSNSPLCHPMRRHLKTIPSIHYHPLSLADQCMFKGPSPNTLHTIHSSSSGVLPPLHRTPTAPETRRHRHMAVPTKDGLTLPRRRLPPNITPQPLRARPLTPSSSLFRARSNVPAASVRHLRHSARNPPSHRDLDPTSVSSTSSTSFTPIQFTLTKKRNHSSSHSLVIMSSSYREASDGFIKSMRRSRRDRAPRSRSTSRG
jgi:hypothetical protein